MGRFPEYPNFVPFSKDTKTEIMPLLQNLKDGISELTFYSLLIHTKKYNYRITQTKSGAVLLLRKKDEKNYFIPINQFPLQDETLQLNADGYFATLVSASIMKNLIDSAPEIASTLSKDRDNADYVYLKNDLIELKGKAFHKKKNHLNAFIKKYSPSVELLTIQNVKDAKEVLEKWQKNHLNIQTDYETTKAALDLIGEANFFGIIVYVQFEPIGFALGETMNDEITFCTHFEKGLEEFRGIYQYLNQILAVKLDEKIQFINREQDLGDEGLRQSEMTYRPVKFIEKYCSTLG